MVRSSNLTLKVQELLKDAERILSDSPEDSGLKVREAYNLIANFTRDRRKKDWINARHYYGKKIKYLDHVLSDNGVELELKYVTYIPVNQYLLIN